MTSDFEWSLISGRRRFRWPLVSIFVFDSISLLRVMQSTHDFYFSVINVLTLNHSFLLLLSLLHAPLVRRFVSDPASTLIRTNSHLH